jgi:hypothetical protein
MAQPKPTVSKSSYQNYVSKCTKNLDRFPTPLAWLLGGVDSYPWVPAPPTPTATTLRGYRPLCRLLEDFFAPCSYFRDQAILKS